MKNQLYRLLATGLGTGYAPIAPGTVGRILACLIVWLLYIILPGFFVGNIFHCFIALAIVCIFLILGVWSSDFMESQVGKDPSIVVIDEMVGVWISLLFMPFSIQNLVLALVLFRFFDIAKPLGIRRVEYRFTGGWGIMLDDVLAGVYTNLVLQVLSR